MSVLEKVRRWIDGDSNEMVLENAARDAQVKPHSKAEAFVVKVARAIESVMQSEMLPLPQGTTIIPTEYTIFLNTDDDKEWQGVKRRGLEQGLYHILAERAREIAGKKKLETKSFVIELRIDATLEKGDVRVQHSWEDSTSNKTGVLARPKNLPAVPATPQPQTARATNPNITTHEREYTPPAQRPPGFDAMPPDAAPLPKTISNANIQQTVPIPQEEDGEMMTNVRKRVSELYRLEIWMNGVRQNVVPIFNSQISVGRGSKSKPVDIALSGDPEISRRHCTIGTDGAGSFWVVNEGRNAAMINTYELPIGQRVPIKPGISLAVGTYILRIQPRS